MTLRHDLPLAALRRAYAGSLRFCVSERAGPIAYISDVVTLERSDVILTGTPDGVGYFRDPRIALARGNSVEVDVEGVAPLTNPVALR